MTALLDHAREKRKTVTEEVEFSGRHLLCSTAFPGTSEEVVLIMHDITDIHEFEKTKHDFIVNASHELQTPLTAIKGFVETMEEEEQDETKRHYFEIIRRHTDRLVNIVRDLLLLSRLEEMDMNLEMEEINLQAMVGDMEKLFEVRLRDRGLRLVKNIPDSLPALRADRFKIEQMFINLIDNAIKYTDQGEITITAGLRGGSMVIEVADTGMGIAMEHIPRIFERFYVADRSHSKKAGGTGLGLSIVKHIVLLHNGSIDVESIRGKGTKFIIHLPL
jgi:two-component system phosphate regulon sensor histidine kinase PhoR